MIDIDDVVFQEAVMNRSHKGEGGANTRSIERSSSRNISITSGNAFFQRRNGLIRQVVAGIVGVTLDQVVSSITVCIGLTIICRAISSTCRSY